MPRETCKTLNWHFLLRMFEVEILKAGKE